MVIIKIVMCVNGGTFVATHHVFFKLVCVETRMEEEKAAGKNKDKETDLAVHCVRLVQHTLLPLSVLVDKMVRKNCLA